MAEELMLKENENMIIKTDAKEGTLVPKADEVVKMIMLKKKEILELEKKIKEILIEQMEANQILKLTTDNVSVNYIEKKTEKLVFDEKRFLLDYPELYSKYTKPGNERKAYITIKTK